jgi:hypothetical protein
MGGDAEETRFAVGGDFVLPHSQHCWRAEGSDQGSQCYAPWVLREKERRTSLWGICATPSRCAYLFFPAHISTCHDRAAEGCRALCRGGAAGGGGKRGWRRAWYARGRAKGSFKAVEGSCGGVWYAVVVAVGAVGCGSEGDVGSSGQGRRMSRDGSSQTTGRLRHAPAGTMTSKTDAVPCQQRRTRQLRQVRSGQVWSSQVKSRRLVPVPVWCYLCPLLCLLGAWWC